MNNTVIALILSTLVCSSGGLILLCGSSEGATTEEIDVFLLAGQSNGAYSFRCNPDEAQFALSSGIAYYYGTSENPAIFESYSPDITNYGIYDMSNGRITRIGGEEASFASTYHALTGHKVLIVNVAIGGSKVVDWYPGADCYTYAQTLFSDAISKLPSGMTVGRANLIWIQGESDPTWQIQAYQNRLTEIFATMQHTSTAHSNFNEEVVFEDCIVSLVRQYRGVNTCFSQIELCANNPVFGLGFIGADLFNYDNGLLYNDNTHYTQKARNIVGESLAKSFVELFA